MKNIINRSLLIGYGISILILLVTGIICYTVLTRMLTSNRLVTHSSQVIQNLDQLLSRMKDAEAGQRGYLLTERQQFLEPYHGAARDAIALAAETKRLTADNPVQQRNLSAIEYILTNRLNILQKLIQNHNSRHLISDDDLATEKNAMDALRSAVSKAIADEHQLLNDRSRQLSRYSSMAPLLIVIALGLAVVIALFSYFRIFGDMRAKDDLNRQLVREQGETAALNEELTAANEEVTAANEELTSINNSLEERVADRTRALQSSEEETQSLNEELTSMNEELAATNEELVATNEELSAAIDELRDADERRAKLAAIVESSDDAIIGKSLEGIITSWNCGAEKIFGFTESEIVGQSVLTLIPEELQHEEPGILERLGKGEKIDHYETIRRKSDGTLINVSLTISPIHDKNGRVIGVSKIARDITEQKRDEQRKSDFIGMASHELKTPLTSLVALVQVLQQKTKEYPDTFIPNALNRANQQARKMTTLINGFLNISRLESGQLEINKQPFDLADLIHDQLDEIKLTVSSHTFIFDQNEPIPVVADVEKISSVISNLLSNAVKYSPKGKVVQISCLITGKFVQVSVKDEGMGVSKEHLPHIFDRYYRARTTHTQQISGFGVGLYLSAEIIARHEGRIWAESEKGNGSVFSFTLPV
jgi:PAS domain S-box-containing protein